MKRLAVAGLGGAIVFASLAFALWMALQPPRFPVPERGQWIFRNVTLVEAGRAPRTGVSLRVDGDRIAALSASDDRSERPSSEASGGRIDTREFAGLYVAPGLSDLHVHYPPRVAVGNTELWSLLLLAHGVTSIRETGSVDGSIFATRASIRAGRFPGPRIFACGAMLDGENPSFPTNRVVATSDAARAAVTQLAELGADCIKAYNMLSPAALAAIHEAAADAGLPVIGHAPHAVSFEEARLVDLQHGTGAVLIDRERVGRQDFRDEDWQTMTDERIDHVARVSLEQDIAHTPTLVNSRMRRLLAAGQRVDEAMQRDSGLRHLPRFWAAAWRTIWGAPFESGDPESEARNELFRNRQAWMTGRLHEAGVRIHAGTDTLMPFVAPGSSLHGELVDLVAAGIAPDAVWEIATREAGRSLGLAGLGTLVPGAPADLIFLRADPSQRLTALRDIEAVMADGRLYRRADLDAMLAAADAHFQGPLYTTVMDGVVSLVQGQFRPERRARDERAEGP